MKRALFACVLAALVTCHSALAHGGGVPGFSSTVREITPPVPGLRVRVLERDDHLLLEDRVGADIVILGYNGEPYLRFKGGAVYQGSSPRGATSSTGTTTGSTG